MDYDSIGQAMDGKPLVYSYDYDYGLWLMIMPEVLVFL